jgi:predicted nucleic acid-binding protein
MAPVTSTATWLVDTSALARLAVPQVDAVLRPRIGAGRVAVSALTWLELGFTARSLDDHAATIEPVLGRLQLVFGSPRTERRAIEVQRELLRTGHHRAVKLPDLLIASTAEAEQLSVLHYDADFDRIHAVTGQRVEWVVPAGSVP